MAQEGAARAMRGPMPVNSAGTPPRCSSCLALPSSEGGSWLGSSTWGTLLSAKLER